MATSKPVMGLYDKPMWESMKAGRLELQKCRSCGKFRYPPAPICAHCLSMEYDWTPVSGKGKILSWVIFHRQYFEDFPAPFNCVAVQLEEGPIIVTNLKGDEPKGSWIDAKVELAYAEHAGRMQHYVQMKSR
jgi:uncharacterized OB-fold protein